MSDTICQAEPRFKWFDERAAIASVMCTKLGESDCKNKIGGKARGKGTKNAAKAAAAPASCSSSGA